MRLSKMDERDKRFQIKQLIWEETVTKTPYPVSNDDVTMLTENPQKKISAEENNPEYFASKFLDAQYNPNSNQTPDCSRIIGLANKKRI